MSIRLSSILRKSTDWSVFFWCPGCKRGHAIVHKQNPHNPNGPVWTWNGDVNKPTFSPSLLITYPANSEATEEFKEWRTERRCHSFIIDGKIQFLSDSTHELSGQTVDIPDFPSHPLDR